MELQKFVESFFTNLKAEWKNEGDVLVVTKINKEFEDYYGKKVPYKFVFSGEVKGDEELIAKGSSLLKVIAAFLENRGQTSLVKINFNFDKIDIEKFLKFKNCEIQSLTKENKFAKIVRFSFQTTFQYLNDKEQSISEISVGDEGVMDIHLEKYPLVEGKKTEIEIGDIKNHYLLAKDKLKLMLEPKIKRISDMLDRKLEKETIRIREHYKSQIKEIQLSLASKGKDEEVGDITSKLAKEEEFFIKDEEHKHSLNITNSLLNTTIIYYPIFYITLWLKNNQTTSSIQISYETFKKQLESVKCESCKNELREISLCAGGHVSCSSCLEKCRECGKDFCKACLTRTCSYCNKKLCSKCYGKCLKCGKIYCLQHVKKPEMKCVSCLKRCSCGNYSDKFEKCSCGREFCEKCREIIFIGGRKFCKNCSKLCNTCNKIYPLHEFS